MHFHNATGTEDANFFGTKLIRFGHIWFDLGEIWAKVFKIWAKLKSCIPKSIRSLMVMRR